MMRAEVRGNAIEVTFSRGEAAQIAMAATLAAVLGVLAGWQVAFVTLGLSLLGAGAVDIVQQSDLTSVRR